MNNTIDFEYDFKKLHCPNGHIFTTIRRDCKENWEKYGDLITTGADKFLITLKGKPLFYAILLNIQKFPSIEFMRVKLRWYDTDGSIPLLRNRYKEEPVLLLILRKVGKVKEAVK